MFRGSPTEHLSYTFVTLCMRDVLTHWTASHTLLWQKCTRDVLLVTEASHHSVTKVYERCCGLATASHHTLWQKCMRWCSADPLNGITSHLWQQCERCSVGDQQHHITLLWQMCMRAVSNPQRHHITRTSLVHFCHTVWCDAVSDPQNISRTLLSHCDVMPLLTRRTSLVNFCHTVMWCC